MTILFIAILVVLASSPAFAFKDCETCPEMIEIPAGQYKMGTRRQYTVDIGYDFAVGMYEVTQAEWRAIMGTNPSDFGDDRFPVEQVSWNDVQVFLQKLSEKTGETYRLLSESEWEYVARGGSTSKWSCGKIKACVKDIGWYRGISTKKTHPVGQKAPNGFGLYDTAGNVREWTADCYQAKLNDAPRDGSAVQIQKECHKRSVRGGSWNYLPRDSRPANRHKVFVTFRLNDLGFRLARGGQHVGELRTPVKSPRP